MKENNFLIRIVRTLIIVYKTDIGVINDVKDDREHVILVTIIVSVVFILQEHMKVPSSSYVDFTHFKDQNKIIKLLVLHVIVDNLLTGDYGMVDGLVQNDCIGVLSIVGSFLLDVEGIIETEMLRVVFEESREV